MKLKTLRKISMSKLLINIKDILNIEREIVK